MEDKITVRLPGELRQAIERLRNEQPSSFRSTQAACRHIIEAWLTEQGYFVRQQTELNVPVQPPSDAQTRHESENG
jgi:Arc/MetJ-type ribon-helix-helix transcriptional regulator